MTMWAQSLVNFLLLLVGMSWPPVEAEAVAARRLALVLGNGDYQHLPDLKNPENDAALLSQVLARHGFDVAWQRGLSSDATRRTIAEFAGHVSKGDTVVVFYAGHGVQIESENYMVPTDIRESDPQSLVQKLVPVSAMLAEIASRSPRLIVLILDACRDNPFAASGTVANGLADIDVGGQPILIAFSTAPGKVSYDGAGRNSPYVNALVSAMDVEGLDLIGLFQQVRGRVRDATSGRQIPWISVSLEDGFVFNQGAVKSGPATVSDTLDLEPLLHRVAENTFGITGSDADLEVIRTYFAGSIQAEQGAKSRKIILGNASPPPEQAAPDRTMPSVGARHMVTTNDRVPPDALAWWPPPVLEGLADLAVSTRDCDVHAADPDDVERVYPGISSGLMNTRAAVRACTIAVREHPDIVRYQFQLARALDVSQRFSEARRLYEIAAAAGASGAMLNLGYMYEKGRGVDIDLAKAASYYEQAALEGNLRARNALGGFYQYGRGVRQSYAEAFRWYSLAAWSGWPDAMDSLGNLYRRGLGVKADPEMAVTLYRMAADLGQTNAINNLAGMYRDGTGVEADVQRAVALYRQASELGNKFAPFHLGRLFEAGWGVEKDTATAKELYLIAGERGFSPAYERLADLILAGKPSRDERLQAFAYLSALDKRSKEAEAWMRDFADQIDSSERAHAQLQARLIRERERFSLP